MVILMLTSELLKTFVPEKNIVDSWSIIQLRCDLNAIEMSEFVTNCCNFAKEFRWTRRPHDRNEK